MANKITNIKERILYFASYKGIAYEKFFPEIGMTYASFKGKAKDRPINSNALENILSNHPDLNPSWLIKGEEPMLLTDLPTSEIKEVYVVNEHGVPDTDEESWSFKNSSGNTFTELPNGRFVIKVPKIPYTAYASFIEVYADEYRMSQTFDYAYFTVDKIGRGKYLSFPTSNDSMNGGGLYDTPGGAEVLVRELERSHWQDGFRKTDYGWIIVSYTGILHKDIENTDTKGVIRCVSRNESPEFRAFDLNLDEVHSIYKVIKRLF